VTFHDEAQEGHRGAFTRVPDIGWLHDAIIPERVRMGNPTCAHSLTLQ
jgi:hypothetical protein